MSYLVQLCKQNSDHIITVNVSPCSHMKPVGSSKLLLFFSNIKQALDFLVEYVFVITFIAIEE